MTSRTTKENQTMKRIHGITAIALTGVVGLSTLFTPIAASASEQGRRNTALGLGAAATLLLLTQKDKTPGILAAGGALIAASQIGRDRDHGGYDWNRDHRDNSFRDNRDNSFRDN